MTPARLGKVEEPDHSFTSFILELMMEHPNITFIILFLILAALCGLLFNVMYGMFTIESGIMRNFMNTGMV